MQPSSASSPDLSLRKRPLQARSAALVDTILQAAAQVIETEGAAAFTTNRVAERAGVSIGSLYQYFPNRDVILAKLAIRAEAQLRGQVETILTQADDICEGLAGMAGAAFEHYLAAPRLHAALAQAEARLGPLVKEELAGAEQRMSDLIAAFVAASRQSGWRPIRRCRASWRRWAITWSHRPCAIAGPAARPNRGSPRS